MASRGIKADGMRRLVDAAIAAGWTKRVDGQTHVVLTNPANGKSFRVSATAKDGRDVKNVRAVARRAGLDV